MSLQLGNVKHDIVLLRIPRILQKLFQPSLLLVTHWHQELANCDPRVPSVLLPVFYVPCKVLCLMVGGKQNMNTLWYIKMVWCLDFTGITRFCYGLFYFIFLRFRSKMLSQIFRRVDGDYCAALYILLDSPTDELSSWICCYEERPGEGITEAGLPLPWVRASSCTIPFRHPLPTLEPVNHVSKSTSPVIIWSCWKWICFSNTGKSS